MDKNTKFSDRPTKEKIIYAVVIAVLAITAIIVGIVSIASKKDDTPPAENPPASDGGDTTPDGGSGDEPDDGSGEEEKPAKLTFVSPVVGTVAKGHSMDTPVFSTTLGEYRIHMGIDIGTDEGAEVFSSEKGVVSKVYKDPKLGSTVEVTHEGGIVSVYSNLNAGKIAVKEGDEIASGTLIGCVGDSAITEICDEAHLHFEIRVNGSSVNPLDYISEESKSASLGITSGGEEA